MCGLLDDGDDAPEEPQADPGETPEAEGPDAETPDAPDAGDADAQEGGDEPDLDVEDTLKDLAARMSRLSSHIEGIEQDREEMEDKIDDVEDQLGQLGNLAEVVSSQYNPFVAESQPGDPDWNPMEQEVMGGAEGLPEQDPKQKEPGREAMSLDEAALEEPGNETLEEPAPQEDPTPEPETGPEAGDDGAGDQGAGDDGAGEDEAMEPEGLPPAAGDELGDALSEDGHDEAPEEGRRFEHDGPPDPANLDLADAPDPTLGEEDAFDRNVLLLEWVGFMLERVGREGLLDLLEYYESLGWLDDAIKNRALRVATGIDVDDGERSTDWRGDTDLHERTLVVLERLAGRERPASRLEELQLDLQRIFDG